MGVRSSLESRLWQRNRGKCSVTLPLTAEFLSSGNFELAPVKKLGYGSIADIKMRVQVRSTLWKYNERDIQRYSRPDGEVPFSEWLDSLRDLKAKFKIDRRLDRVGTGNFGDYRAVGEGVYELRINYAPAIGSILDK